jgi:pyruvate/2-oxoglutarate dehydrogenase complex dihydrolipoamide dehydrogenase (E3) component
MISEDFDYVVIGGGSAGYSSASTAASAGLKVAVIEGGEDVGGLCILRGCMPSKTLLESSNRYDTIRRAEEFGLHAEKHSASGTGIIERKRRIVAAFADYRRSQLLSGKFRFLRGVAKFLGPHSVEVSWKDEPPFIVRAKTFLIATGSEVHDVLIPGLCDVGCRDSDSVLEWEHIPKSVVILGGGAIALEIAHYYVGLGVRVTLIQRSKRVLREMDGDVAHCIEKTLASRGADIFTGTSLERVEAGEQGKRVIFYRGGERLAVEAEEVIYALGRQPRTSALDLDAAGVRTEKSRPLTNPHQQTSVPHIFAAGDVCGPYEIVHLAIQQGEVAARNAVRLLRGGNELESSDYRLRLFIVFTMPEIAAVGMTEAELTTAECDFRVATYPFNDHGKSLVMGETDGFVKLIANSRNGEILGGAVVGPEASELIHEIAVAMHFRATAKEFAKIPHYHPTLSEIWTYPAEELAGF